eukprot:TRINITY_DN3274_c0_g1_i12.p1 TRINITY_DN3274_c0_g1~~TRINITY_DN3274_c0_g1_i12.p1  ORF type:complete len:145 (+),score=45.33 TRINITY_DN3274_c0_g1_i12:167-601(+)
MQDNFRNFRIMAKVCLVFIFILFLVQLAGRILLMLKKMRNGSDEDEMSQLIKKVLKVFKIDVLIPLVFYTLDISIMAFDLGALILFFLGLCGLAVLVVGEIRGSEEGAGKMLKDIGTAAWHGTTFIMIIVMTARVDYFNVYVYK